MLNKREKTLLFKLIKDYIDLGRPISSEFLQSRHNFSFSPATVRIEFQKLTAQGYLYKNYVSGGRIPTDKAYRFLVNYIIKKEKNKVKKFNLQIKKIYSVDNFIFLNRLVKILSKRVQSMVVVYLKEKNFLLKEGWEEMIKKEEFKKNNFWQKFCQFLNSFEKNIKKLNPSSDITVYIGKENPFPFGEDFSLILSKVYLPSFKETVFSVLGPKRMDYYSSIRSLINLKNLFFKND